MKKILNFMIAAVLIAGTSFAQEQEALEEGITQEQAVEIATMAWGKEVTDDTEIQVNETGSDEYWEVTFKSKANPVGGSMIRVDAKTGESKKYGIK
jgi:hypothetical protein